MEKLLLEDNDLVPALAEISPNEMNNDIPREAVWLQQYGAPAYFDLAVCRFLDDVNDRFDSFRFSLGLFKKDSVYRLSTYTRKITMKCYVQKVNLKL